MRIVLAPVGTRGDVQPLIALSRELVARGHDVVLCAADNFASLAALGGARFMRGGRDAQAIVAEAGSSLSTVRGFTRAARQSVEEQFDLLEAACQGADLLIGTPLLAAGDTISERLRLRVVCATYFPHILPSTDLPPPFFPKAPRFLVPLAWATYRALSNYIVAPVIARARASRGMGPSESMFAIAERTRVLCAFDDVLGTAPKGWTAKHHLTGFWFLDDETPLPLEVERFLAGGEPPVFVGFGSMPHNEVEARARAVAGAVNALGCRAIVAAGWGKLHGVDALVGAGRVMTVGGTNHRLLFPRCAAVVHHGGAGTTSQAARAGVPQVVVPHLFDQFYWAARTAALGVSPPPIDVHFSAAVLARALRSALARREAARELAGRIPVDGVTRAVHWLDELG